MEHGAWRYSEKGGKGEKGKGNTVGSGQEAALGTRN